MRIDLPEGAWAELADPRKVSERRRRSYVNAMAAFNAATASLPRTEDGNPDPRFCGSEHAELLDTALDLLTVALIKAWSYEQPVTVEAIQDLPVDVFDALRKAATDRQTELLPNYSPDIDPKAHTVGSPTPPMALSSVDGSTSTTR